jgi:capsular exopolysaccharide synthesis family protein
MMNAHEATGHVAPSALDDVRQTLYWAWRIIWRGKYLILGCWLLFIVPTILILQQTTRLYTATAEILVEGPEASDMLSGQSANMMYRFNDAIMPTEVSVVSSLMLAERVVNRLELYNDPEFNPALREPSALAGFFQWLNPMRWLISLSQQSPPSTGAELSAEEKQQRQRGAVVQAFQSRLLAEYKRRSFIITVSFTSENKEKAARIANAVAEAYVMDRLEASFDNARRVTGWLGERLTSLRKDVSEAESAVEEYRATYGLRRKSDNGSTINEQQLSELNSRLVVTRSELAQKQARMDQVRNLLQSQGSLEAMADVLQSPLIQRMREQQTTIQREMSEALKTYGDRHPRIVGYRADLAELNGRINDEMRKISDSISNEVAVASAGVRTLERELGALRAQNNVAGGAEIRLRELERQAETSRQLYETFLSRFKRDAEQDSVKRANARVISEAQAPGGSSYPRPAQTLSVISVLALALGVVITFLIDHLDSAIRSSDEAESLAGAPTLAILPSLRGRGDDIAKNLIEKPRSAVADALRGLRIALKIGLEDTGGRAPVVVITSSTPKEGKTFLATGLAVTWGRAEGNVLLIDGDIHRPRLHNMLGCDNEQGLVQVLSGTATADDVIVSGISPGLDLIPAGHMSNVADLLSQDRIEAIVEGLRGRYSQIIIDGPPVLAIADSRILARIADRVIYVVRWNTTPRDAVRNGLKLLREAKAPLFGTVLSQVNRRRHARYDYGDYGSYYGRYTEYYADQS